MRHRWTTGLSAALLPLIVAAAAVRAEAQTKAYVTQAGANVVSVIDTATAAAVGTVPVAGGPAHVAVTADGARAYITDGAAASVSVVETASDTVVATIPVGVQPSAIAVTPDGSLLYVLTAGGVDVVDTARQAVVTTIPIGAQGGGIAITPDGTRAYVAAGLVYVIDTATNAIVKSFAAETQSIAGIANNASSVAISRDGTRAYIGVYTFDTTVFAGFTAYGFLVVVDTASASVTDAISLFSLPASIALTPDGSRAYVGIQAQFVNTGYGMGFLPASWVFAVDTIGKRIAAVIYLGGDSAEPTQQNTAAGIAVAPDRGAVYIAVPRLRAVAVAGVSTNTVTSLIPLAASPGDVAVLPDRNAALVPYAVDAADDAATVTTAGGTAVANVTANDRLGGFAATDALVTMTQVSSTSGALTLDPSTGSVNAAAGIPVGEYTLVYRLCERAAAANCDDAVVAVTVRAPFAIDAVNDSASTPPGGLALANVLANDTLDGTAATPARVTLSVVSSTSATIALDVSNGAVYVWAGTEAGTHTLRYQICEIASPANCDRADVTISVAAFPIDAANDAGSATRSGGTAVVNVLANDTFAGAAAALATVRLSQVSSTHEGVALDAATGAVTVLPLQITAVNDAARGSSKVASTVLASVLTNDSLGGARATTANVRLSFVSLSPANNQIRLDLADGSVDVLGKTSSGTYSLVYQICETAMPANCSRATVAIDLSGR